MIITQEQSFLLESTIRIYKDYIDFNKYSITMIDYYIQEMFKDSYIKHKDQVLACVPRDIVESCSKAFIDNANIINFFDDNNNLLLTTYSQCLEDVVGMNKIKAFIFD